MEQVKACHAPHGDANSNIIDFLIRHIEIIAVSALLLCTAVGISMTNFFSRQKLVSQGNVVIYERLACHNMTNKIHIYASSENGRVHLIIPDQYFETNTLDNIDPLPNRYKVFKNHHIYTFSSEQSVSITLYATPFKPRRNRSTLTINSSSFQLSYFIYPKPWILEKVLKN
ncbi:MAG: hypothetical protein ACOYXT_14685 [Bacteroidota bacterium]